jgi:transposase
MKGQKYTLLSRKENLMLEGRQALRTLLRANKRLKTAYLLKESFGQLWSCEQEGWSRRFFENWRASLKWQRLKPYEKFADMIDRHWDGIAAYRKPENKVSLGFVEGLNNKIRVIQRRACGYAIKRIFASKSSPVCYLCYDASPWFWLEIHPHDFTKSHSSFLKAHFSLVFGHPRFFVLPSRSR